MSNPAKPLLFIGKLPYGTSAGPTAYFPGEPASEADEGDGSYYPLRLTEEEYVYCFWRVKKWKLALSVSIFKGTEDDNYTYSGDLTFFFERIGTGAAPLLTEKQIPFLENKYLQSIWASEPATFSDIGQHNFKVEDSMQSEDINITFSATLDQREGINDATYVAVGKSREQEDKLASYLNMEIAADDGITFSGISGLGTKITSQSKATISLNLFPGEDPIPVKLYEVFEGSLEGVSISAGTLEPCEWFAYEFDGLGPVWETDTGDFIT
ncbi:hypothetical protein EBR96_05865 [bacterium]|nr:hypothetical protein [bacterium]